MSNELYSVIITDSIGCTLDTVAFVEPTIGCFFIATALTPNGDGINDQWLVGGLEYFPEASVMVFNRWGQLLFESKGYTAAWDGTYKGENLATADYYFIIDYSPQAEPITGTVTIKY
jgi:gliding motility-associated-like protein